MLDPPEVAIAFVGFWLLTVAVLGWWIWDLRATVRRLTEENAAQRTRESRTDAALESLIGRLRVRLRASQGDG